MIFLIPVFLLIIADARPVSDPVPAVVGIAIIDEIFFSSALFQLSPTSSKSQIDLVCPDIKAIAFPTSIALPPPIAITPSQLFILNSFTPSSTFSPNGLPVKFEKIFNSLNLFEISDIISFMNGKLIKSLSVTNKGLVIFKFKGSMSTLRSRVVVAGEPTVGKTQIIH